MKLLLDTQALIWFMDNNPRLSAPARRALEDPENEIFYSGASIWEMAIKISLGKLKLRGPLDHSFRELLNTNGLEFLAVEFDHAARVATLPRQHHDPFDRLLIAQCMIEGLRPVSNDEAFDSYPIERLW